MKITALHRQILKDYLDRELAYRETYEEIYDHILSGLENEAGSLSFPETIDNYVMREFGGIKGLRGIEQQQHAMVLKGVKRQYFNNVIDNFRFPGIIFFLTAAVLVYVIFNAGWFTGRFYFFMFLLMSLSTTLIHNMRHVKLGYKWKSTKRSVKDDGFAMIKFAPGRIIAFLAVLFFLLFRFIDNHAVSQLFNLQNPLIQTILLMAYAVHAKSFYELYRADFKVDSAKI